VLLAEVEVSLNQVHFRVDLLLTFHRVIEPVFGRESAIRY